MMTLLCVRLRAEPSSLVWRTVPIGSPRQPLRTWGCCQGSREWAEHASCSQDDRHQEGDQDGMLWAGLPAGWMWSALRDIRAGRKLTIREIKGELVFHGPHFETARMSRPPPEPAFVH